MFACLYAPPRGLAFRSADGAPRAKCVTNQLVRLAREYSPRIEIHGDNLVVLDTAGLTGRPGSSGMFCDARELGATLRRSAADRGLCLRIAIASTRTAALLVVQERSGLTVIEPGRETVTLASLPLTVLKALAQAQETATGARRGTRVRGAALAIPAFALLSTVRRWGVSTLGDLAHLPSAELFERLGVGGLTLQRFARGEDGGPLVPTPVEERFESSLVLEWPVEGLDPLSFVLSRVFDQLCARLERAGVGAAVIRVCLKLVTREIQTRTLQLPTPLRDPRVLRTLVLLDLESHPPSAGIDQVTVVVDPVPARTQQFSLLERARPSPEAVSTLIARLTALAGESRCGSPALVDSHDMASFEIRPFDPSTKLWVDGESHRTVDNNTLGSAQDRRGKGKPRLGADSVRETPVDGDWRQETSVCSQKTGGTGGLHRILQQPASGALGRAPLCPMLRRFRVPIAARVRVQKGRPVRVMAPRVPGGEVVHWAGPWRTSGQWWTEGVATPSSSDPSQQFADKVSGVVLNAASGRSKARRGSIPAVFDQGATPPDGMPRPENVRELLTRDTSASSWDRDAWDVSLTDGGVYRIFHDRRVDRWFLEGLVD